MVQRGTTSLDVAWGRVIDTELRVWLFHSE